MKSKHLILLFLIPLSEIKALFYSSDLKVSWYLFSDHKRFICQVLEDYANIIILSTVFYYLCFLTIDKKTKQIAGFLFIINILDFIHLGLMDMQYFTPLKLLLAFVIFKICSRLRIL